ncbi:hypothetical protein ACFQVA_37805 [Actinomadura keratinilytica]
MRHRGHGGGEFADPRQFAGAQRAAPPRVVVGGERPGSSRPRASRSRASRTAPPQKAVDGWASSWTRARVSTGSARATGSSVA